MKIRMQGMYHSLALVVSKDSPMELRIHGLLSKTPKQPPENGMILDFHLMTLPCFGQHNGEENKLLIDHQQDLIGLDQPRWDQLIRFNSLQIQNFGVKKVLHNQMEFLKIS